MDGIETKNPRGAAAADRQEGASAVTSARAQFEAAAGAARPERSAPALSAPALSTLARAEAVFDRLDWSGTVGDTVRSATVRMDGRRDGPGEVLMYDLDGSGLLAWRDESADGASVSLHFLSASSRGVYDRVLRSVGYLNRAADPHGGERRFDVEVIDATGFPVKLGERALWVETRTAAADAFDTLSPEVIRFDLDDHLAEPAVAFDDAAFARERTPADWRAEPAAAPSPARSPAAAAASRGAGDGDRFAALYGEAGYSVHWQSRERAAAVRAEAVRAEADAPARTPVPSIFPDGAEIYHIYRPAGATAGPEATPQSATMTVASPASFTQDDRVRVFRRRAPAPAAEAAAAQHAPDTADREALHFADMFEGDVGPDGLEGDPVKRAERDFLFGLGRSQAA